MSYFLTERTFIHKIEAKYNLESDLEVSLLFFTDQCYKKMRTFCVKCREKTENLNANIDLFSKYALVTCSFVFKRQKRNYSC